VWGESSKVKSHAKNRGKKLSHTQQGSSSQTTQKNYSQFLITFNIIIT
jgi:hypothetical protein